MRTCYANVLLTATFKECLNQQSYSLTGSQGKKKICGIRNILEEALPLRGFFPWAETRN